MTTKTIALVKIFRLLVALLVVWKIQIVQTDKVNNIIKLSGHDPKHCAIVVDHNTEKRDNQFLCITYASVDETIAKAAKIHKFSLENMKRDSSPKEISKLAELLLETTRLLHKEYNLSRSIDLSSINTQLTKIGRLCPSSHSTPFLCPPIGRYRTIDGTCNNLQHPHWGASGMTFTKFLPKEYSDGISSIRKSSDGPSLPNPRIIRLHIHKDKNKNQGQFTTLFMTWGQLISHDVSFVAQTLSDKFAEELCCNVPDRHPNCLPIDVGPRDPFYSRYKISCMEFVRSLAGLRVGCSLGAREQINQLTSHIDASFIYGSNPAVARSLRAYKLGLMESNTTLNYYGFKELLPPRIIVPQQACFRKNDFCFEAGDKRINENILLSTLHTLWMREHNRIAAQLHKLNPLWDDDKLFQETRHIVAALVQFIVYSEYLPLVLGPKLMQIYDLEPLKQGYYDGYDPTVDTGTAYSVQAAALRFGHSQIANTIEKRDRNNRITGSAKHHLLIQQPFDLYTPGQLDAYVRGMINQIGQDADEAMAEEMTNHLFQNPHDKFGLDLASINIQRGRDHGVLGYNAWRIFCGLKKAESFDEMNDLIDQATIEKYKNIYRHPDDVDLWSAGMSERPLPDGVVGPTFGCLLGKQFSNYRKGDRFWFENRGWLSSFSPSQLQEIRKASLARIICDNTDDVEFVQKQAMKSLDALKNPQVTCSKIPSIDLTQWIDGRV